MRVPVILKIHPTYLVKQLRDRGFDATLQSTTLVNSGKLYVIPSLLTIPDLDIDGCAQILFITTYAELSLFGRKQLKIVKLNSFKPFLITKEDLQNIHIKHGQQDPVKKLQGLLQGVKGILG